MCLIVYLIELATLRKHSMNAFIASIFVADVLAIKRLL